MTELIRMKKQIWQMEIHLYASFFHFSDFLDANFKHK